MAISAPPHHAQAAVADHQAGCGPCHEAEALTDPQQADCDGSDTDEETDRSAVFSACFFHEHDLIQKPVSTFWDHALNISMSSLANSALSVMKAKRGSGLGAHQPLDGIRGAFAVVRQQHHAQQRALAPGPSWFP